jgi:hypothetical protein
MMNAQTKQLERERLLKVAQEYRQKGYEVIISPRQEELPEFLKDYRYLPDMIVRRGEDAAVIEVKSRRSMMSSASNFKRLAEVINAHPGWRLELIMTNPDDEFYSYKLEDSLEADEIKSRLQIAKQLTNNYPEAAMLVIWSLAEATLRLLLEHEGLMLQKLESPLHLLKLLATEGIISQTDYQLLVNNFQSRNAIAHGFKTTSLTINSVLELIEVIEQLLNLLNADSTA